MATTLANFVFKKTPVLKNVNMWHKVFVAKPLDFDTYVNFLMVFTQTQHMGVWLCNRIMSPLEITFEPLKNN